MPKRQSSRRIRPPAQRKAIFAALMQKHQGLVRKIVNPYAYKHPHLREDLMSAGNEGLFRFAKRYNPKRAQFTTGAYQAIKSRVQREVFKSKLIRVPEKPMRKMAKQGPLITTGELHDIMGQSSEGGIGQVEARVTLSKLMSRLSPTERKVVFLQAQGHPLRVIGKKIGKISSNRVLKIHRNALKKMRVVES